jgi:ferredoxin
MVDVDRVLQEFVQERGIPIFGIASPDGFKHALPGWHPEQTGFEPCDGCTPCAEVCPVKAINDSTEKRDLAAHWWGKCTKKPGFLMVQVLNSTCFWPKVERRPFQRIKNPVFSGESLIV